MTRILTLCFLALLFMTQPQMVSAEGAWTDTLQKDIRQWIASISAHDQQFANWQDARSQIRALGANQHQWLVTLSKGGKHVGYLVVGELQNRAANTQQPSFALLEYGAGEYVLFDDTLAPDAPNATTVYDGFSSFWKITADQQTQYIDAKTGERYPVTFTPDAARIEKLTMHDVATPDKSLVNAKSLSMIEENPFDQINWVATSLTPPKPKGESSWQSLLSRDDDRSAVLTVSLFHDQVTAPFSIGAVHVWDNDAAYVGVWNEGIRFVPYQYASQIGRIINN